MKLKFNINGKMVVYVLGTALLIYLTTIGYIAFDLKSRSAANAMGSYETLAFNESQKVSKTLSHYSNWLKNTGTALKSIDKIAPEQRRNYSKQLISEFISNEENIQAVGLVWNGSIDESDSTFINQSGNASNENFAPYFTSTEGQINLSENHASKALLSSIEERDENQNILMQSMENKEGSIQLSYVISNSGDISAILFLEVDLLHFTQDEALQHFDNFIINNEGQIVSSNIDNISSSDWPTLMSQFEQKYEILSAITKGQSTSGIDQFDYNHNSYFFAFNPIKSDSDNWAMGIAVPKSIITSESMRTFYVTSIISILGLALLSIVLFAISKSISNPLLKANGFLQQLVNGDLSQKEKNKFFIQDEIADMSHNMTQLVEGLGSAADFASQIGQGNLDVKYELLSDNDMLGTALIKMQDSLKAAKENEDVKKIEDEKRNWVTHGLAKFGEIIREDNSDIDKFTSNVIKHLLEYIDAAQGAIYIHTQNEYELDEPKTLVLKAAQAYGKPIMLKHEVIVGQELVGRAAQENRIIYLENVPEDYAAISPGMKSQKRPNHILVSPMAINNDIFGVIELLSYNPFEKHQIEFIEKLSENIASVISSVNINLSTAKLLENSRHQADELAQHEEEMRQNLEEMQATQEETLKRQNKFKSHLEGLQNNLITAELDLQGRIISMSPSMTLHYQTSIEKTKGKFYEAVVTNDETLRNNFNEFWTKMLENESGKRIQTIENRGKSTYFLENYQLIQKDGLTARVLISVQNKTREKELSDELKKLASS